MQDQITSTENTMAADESSDAMNTMAPGEVAEAEFVTPLTNFPEIVDKEKFSQLSADNVTMKAFRSAEQLRGLTLKSLSDKDSYKQIYAAHQYLKGLLSTIKKACEAGREPHVAEQKKWIELQKSLTEWVGEIEGPIEEQRKAYEKEQDRLKAEEKKRIEERTNTRAREMQTLGVPFNLKACQEFEEEAWEEFMSPHRQAKAKAELTKIRLAQIRVYTPTASEDEVSDLTDEEFDLFLEQNKEAYEMERERIAERKRIGNERVKSMAAIKVRVSFDDVADLTPDQFEAMLKVELDRIAAEKKEREDREQREKTEREAVEKYTKRFNFIAGKGLTLDEVGTNLDQLKAMADDEWIAFAPKVNEVSKAKQEKARLEEERRENDRREAEKDRKFRDRYAILLGIGVKFDTEMGARVREMTDSEYMAFEEEKKAEFHAYMNRPIEVAPEPDPVDQDDEPVVKINFPRLKPVAIEPEAMTEGDAVREWVSRVRKELEFAPVVTSDKAREFASLRAMALDNLSDILDLFQGA